MNVLLTSGLGYIGSHTAVELIREGHKVVLVEINLGYTLKLKPHQDCRGVEVLKRA